MAQKTREEIEQMLRTSSDRNHKRFAERLYGKELLEEQKWLCYLCGERLEFGNDPCTGKSYLNLEHKIPISRGGTWAKENLGYTHRWCNAFKGRRTVQEYRPRLG